MVREADDGKIVEHLGRIRGPEDNHVRKDFRAFCTEALIDTEGSTAGEEDDIAIVELEIGMASELLSSVARFPRGQ